MLNIEKIEAILFQENNNEPLRTLCLFRFFLCVTCVIFLAFEFNPIFYVKYASIISPSAITSLCFFNLAKTVGILFGILFAIGCDLLIIKLTFLIVFTCFNFYSYLITKNFNYNTHLIFFLLLITFSNCSYYFSFFKSKLNNATNYDKFCIGFAKLYIGFLYFQSFLSKVVNSGVHWFTSGDTIKTYLILKGTYIGKLFLSFPFLLKIISGFTGLFELSFIIVLLFTNKDKYIAILAIIFHVGIFLLMDISFWFLWILFFPLFIYRTTKF